MTTSNNIDVARLFEAYGYRNAAKVKAVAYWIDNTDLETPAGNETVIFKVGQTVVATGQGTIKAGVILTVEAVQKVNGFCQYYAGGAWNKQQDLKGQE
jgi:hypothetical protein